MNSISKLRQLQSKSLSINSHLILFLDHLVSDSINGTSKVSIEISSLESLASQISELNQLEKEKSSLLSTISTYFKSFTSEIIPTLKSSLSQIKAKFASQSKTLKFEIKKVSTVLKEYKERCKSITLYYLKNLDHDLRKILKPLVPSEILKQQIAFPPINKNSSLQSSVESSALNSPRSQIPEKNNPSINEAGGSHTDLLVNTLERVAKDLIAVLIEVNTQYFEIFRERNKATNPPTPLAAPLPEYFVYETEESDIPISSKIIIKEDAQTWIRRFNDLFSNNIIDENVFSILINKVNPLKLRGCRIDLQDVFKDIEISEELKENITFALVNKSIIQPKDVCLADILNSDEKKILVPEPPKQQNPIQKQRAGYMNIKKRSFEFDKNDKKDDQVFASVDYRIEPEGFRGSPIPKFKITSVREKPTIRKSQGSEKREKSSRSRSITPVFLNKDKSSFIAKGKKIQRK